MSFNEVFGKSAGVRRDCPGVEIIPVILVPGSNGVLCCVELDERNVVPHLCPAEAPRHVPREVLEQLHNLLLPDLARYVADEQRG